MKLHEIIEANETPGLSIEIQEIKKYKKSLTTYYKYHNDQLILMVTAIFNACQYGKIVSANEFNEAIEEHINTDDMSEEDKEDERELISFNSILLANL